MWTTDYPSANTSRRLPILDIETWCVETEERTKTVYSFYWKPMANPIAIPARSAISDPVKFSTYRQEVFRIFKNTSLDLLWTDKAEMPSELFWRLRLSGYSEGFSSKILPEDVIRNQKKIITAGNLFCQEESAYDTVLFIYLELVRALIIGKHFWLLGLLLFT